MSSLEFEKRFVTGLGGDARKIIWRKFKEQIFWPVLRLNIPCEFWIDGSFITKCPDPSDLDGSLMILSSVVEALDDEAMDYLDKFDDGNPQFDPVLDMFVCQVYPKGHSQRGGDNDPDGWAKQWSFERNSHWLKGFVVVPVR